MARDCKAQRSIRMMTQKEIQDTLDKQEAVAKDHKEIEKKEDFSAATQ